MWAWLSLVLLVGLIGVHFFWRRRLRKIWAELSGVQQLSAEHQAQQQALFNSMVEGVLLLDPAGRIELVNQSFQRLFGLTSDVRGQTILEAVRLPELAELAKRLPRQRSVHEYQL